MHNNDGDDDDEAADDDCDSWVSDCDDDVDNDVDDDDVDDDNDVDDDDWATAEALVLIGLFNSILSSDSSCASYITISIPIMTLIMI